MVYSIVRSALESEVIATSNDKFDALMIVSALLAARPSNRMDIDYWVVDAEGEEFYADEA